MNTSDTYMNLLAFYFHLKLIFDIMTGWKMNFLENHVGIYVGKVETLVLWLVVESFKSENSKNVQSNCWYQIHDNW